MIKENTDTTNNISFKEYFDTLSENVLSMACQSSNTEDNSGSWFEVGNWFKWDNWFTWSK